MATKTSELPVQNTLTPDDAFVFVNDLAGTPVTQIVPLSVIAAAVFAQGGVLGAPIVLPSLTTSQRNALTPVVGMIIYNSSVNQLQQYAGDPAAWSAIGSGSGGGGGGGASSYDQLTDVLMIEVTDGQITRWDEEAGKWVNTDLSIALIPNLQDALDGLQPLNQNLTEIAGLTITNNSIIQKKSGALAVRTPAQFKTDLALTKDDVGLNNVSNTTDAAKPISSATAAALAEKADLVDGKVPSAQLPSYVDDVEEYADLAAFPETGEAGKIYAAADTNFVYRWTGSAYARLAEGVVLGETSSTAHRGDHGKAAYDHSQLTTGNPHGVTKAEVGLGDADNTSDADKPVSTLQAAAIADVQSDADAAASAIADHVADDANPHGVTKAQVGLSDADNTADSDKPVSTAQAAAIATKQTLLRKTIAASGGDYTDIASAITAGFKQLQIVGTITLPSALTIATAGVSITADPTVGGIIQLDDTAKRISVTAADVTIEGVTFDINSTTNLSANTAGWIEWTGTRGTFRNNFLDLAGVLTATTGCIIYAQSANYFKFVGNRSEGGVGLRAILNPSHNSHIEGNLFIGFQNMSAVYIAGTSGFDMSVIGNRCIVNGMSVSKNVFHFQTSNTGLGAMRVVGNYLQCTGSYSFGSLDGMYFSCGTGNLSANNGSEIKGNTVRGSTSAPYDFGIYINGANMVAVSGNTAGNIYILQTYGCVITGNSCGGIRDNNNNNRYMSVIGNFCRSSISLGGNLYNSVIASNTADPGQGSMTVAGYTNNIYGNTGYYSFEVSGSYHTVAGNNAYASDGADVSGNLNISGTAHTVYGNRYANISDTSTSQKAANMGQLSVLGGVALKALTTAAATTTTLNLAKNGAHHITMGANITTLTLSNPLDGAEYRLFLLQDATGGRTVTWPAAVVWEGGSAPTLSGANKMDVVTMIYNATTSKYYAKAVLNY